MTNEYKVTLSMPVYNVAPYIERALLSALNQTFESIEFLIIDDKGTDNSMDIVRKVIKNHPRGKDVRIIEHPYNIGTGQTKNTAIDNAQGEYLFFMDSDDEITTDCIQVLYNNMITTKADIVVGSYWDIDKNNKKHYIKLDDIYLEGEYCLSKYVYIDKKEFPIPTWNKLYSLKFLREKHIKCIPYHVNEDAIFLCLVLIYASKVKLISTPTTLYYRRDDSTTGSKNKMITKNKIIQELDILSSFYNTSLQYKDKLIRELFSLKILERLVSYQYYISNSMLSRNDKKKFFIDSKKNIYKTPFFKYILATKEYKILPFYIYYKLPFFLQLNIAHIIYLLKRFILKDRAN